MAVKPNLPTPAGTTTPKKETVTDTGSNLSANAPVTPTGGTTTSGSTGGGKPNLPSVNPSSGGVNTSDVQPPLSGTVTDGAQAVTPTGGTTTSGDAAAGGKTDLPIITLPNAEMNATPEVTPLPIPSQNRDTEGKVDLQGEYVPPVTATEQDIVNGTGLNPGGFILPTEQEAAEAQANKYANEYQDIISGTGLNPSDGVNAGGGASPVVDKNLAEWLANRYANAYQDITAGTGLNPSAGVNAGGGVVVNPPVDSPVNAPSTNQEIIDGTGLNPNAGVNAGGGSTGNLPVTDQQIVAGTGLNPNYGVNAGGGSTAGLPDVIIPAPDAPETGGANGTDNPPTGGTNGGGDNNPPTGGTNGGGDNNPPTGGTNGGDNNPPAGGTNDGANNPTAGGNTPSGDTGNLPDITLPTFTDVQGTEYAAPTLANPEFNAVQGSTYEIPTLNNSTFNAVQSNTSATPTLTNPTFNAVQSNSSATPTLTNPTFESITVPEVSASTMPTAPDADIDAIRSQLEEWQAKANEQSAAKADYATQQAITELQRAEQDAQAQFKEQAEAVARDELQGLNNAALDAQARGDKGGIGAAQYNSIQAAAAQNRLAVQQQQTKLSTDTSRQIADLRAQGEFEKADAALETAQSYLQQLTQLEQWAAEYGMSSAQFEAQLAQWQSEFNMAMSQYQTEAQKWNSQMQYQQQQDALANQMWQAEMDYSKEKDQTALNQWNAQMQYQQQQDATANQMWQAEMDYAKEQDQQALDKWNAQMQYQQQQDALANQQWQAELNYAQNQDKTALDKWNAEMQYQKEQDAAEVGMWQQEFGYNQSQDALTAAQKEKSQMASMGEALLSMGIMPSDEQLAAMGLTTEQAQEWAIAAQLAGAQTESVFGTSGATSVTDLYNRLKNAGAKTSEDALAYLTAWGVPSAANYTDSYRKWYSGNNPSGGNGNVGTINQGMYDQLDIMENTSASDAEMYAYIESLPISDADKDKLLEAYNIGG